MYRESDSSAKSTGDDEDVVPQVYCSDERSYCSRPITRGERAHHDDSVSRNSRVYRVMERESGNSSADSSATVTGSGIYSDVIVDLHGRMGKVVVSMIGVSSSLRSVAGIVDPVSVECRRRVRMMRGQGSHDHAPNRSTVPAEHEESARETNSIGRRVGRAKRPDSVYRSMFLLTSRA